jgi:hypothetical protein
LTWLNAYEKYTSSGANGMDKYGTCSIDIFLCKTTKLSPFRLCSFGDCVLIKIKTNKSKQYESLALDFTS